MNQLTDTFPTIELTNKQLAALPDYTLSQPMHLPVGAMWKIVYNNGWVNVVVNFGDSIQMFTVRIH